MASLLLLEADELLALLWLDDGVLEACIVLDGAACVLLATAAGGVVDDAAATGGAANAAALSAISAAPAATIKRTDMETSQTGRGKRACALDFSLTHLPGR